MCFLRLAWFLLNTFSRKSTPRKKIRWIMPLLRLLSPKKLMFINQRSIIFFYSRNAFLWLHEFRGMATKMHFERCQLFLPKNLADLLFAVSYEPRLDKCLWVTNSGHVINSSVAFNMALWFAAHFVCLTLIFCWFKLVAAQNQPTQYSFFPALADFSISKLFRSLPGFDQFGDV